MNPTKEAVHIDLKHCPFCGKNDKGVRTRRSGGETLHRMQCNNCGARTGEYDTLEAALNRWQERY